MKKVSRTQSIIISTIIVAVLLVGCFFAFVPFSCGTKDYASFVGNVRVSSELKEGMFAEYTISSASTKEEISSSMEKIRTILAGEGFVNANVFLKGEDCLRIEIHGPGNTYDLTVYETLLEDLAGGLFELRAGNDDKVVNAIDASKHLKSVEVSSSGSQYFVMINLNEEGKNIYEKLTSESIEKYSGKVYMYLGGEAWPNSSVNSFAVNSVVTNGQVILSVDSRDYAETFVRNIKFGTLEIELDKGSAYIASTTPFFGKNAILVFSLSLLVLFVAVCAFMIAKYRILGTSFAVAMLVNIVVGSFFLQAMPWVELDTSSFIILGVCFVLVAFSSFVIFNKVHTEYALGKQLEPSLASGFAFGIKPVCDLSLIAGLFGLIVAIVGNAQIQTLGTILILYAVVNLFTNCLFIKFLINLFSKIFNANPKHFGVKREESVNEIG